MFVWFQFWDFHNILFMFVWDESMGYVARRRWDCVRRTLNIVCLFGMSQWVCRTSQMGSFLSRILPVGIFGVVFVLSILLYLGSKWDTGKAVWGQ